MLFLYTSATAELPNVLNMLSRTRQPTLAYVPDCPAELKSFNCPTIKIVTEPLDLHWVAKQCHYAVLHGGHGTVAHFLRAGIPMLLLPQVLEQRILAHRVSELGAACYADSARLMDMVKAWIELNKYQRYRQAAEAFAARYADFSDAESVARAVARLEGLLKAS